jgi:hypothetical protein
MYEKVNGKGKSLANLFGCWQYTGAYGEAIPIDKP